MHQEALTKTGAELFLLLKNFNSFYLAGGTALALQIGHRVSVDFDLFCSEEIKKSLLQKANKVFVGKNISIVVNNPEELTVIVDGMKITFLKYPFPILLPLNKLEGVEILSPKEIALTKAYTIGRRGSYKDYVDLFFLFKEKHASLTEVLELAEKKYDDGFNSRLFLEQLLYLEDVGDTPIEFLKEKVGRDQITKFFEEEIKTIKL